MTKPDFLPLACRCGRCLSYGILQLKTPTSADQVGIWLPLALGLKLPAFRLDIMQSVLCRHQGLKSGVSPPKLCRAGGRGRDS